MILHIPHSSTNTLNKDFLCDRDYELERMTDVDTDKLFDYPAATRVIFPFSRLICDVERFEDDALEVMSTKGMGVCYTHTSSGKPLREVTKQERAAIIESYYRPHHKTLTEAVQKELDEKNMALVIDCHSFPNRPLPCDASQKTPRPDICIGSDSFHTPDILLQETVRYFKNCGYTVSANDPFSGTLIPIHFYQKDKRVQGIMLEVNRNLYRDDFTLVKDDISGWLRTVE